MTGRSPPASLQAMKTITLYPADGAVRAELSLFNPTDGGTAELHALLHISSPRHSLQESLALLSRAERELWASDELRGYNPVLKRYFLSDPTNQTAAVEAHEAGQNHTAAVSLIGQAPLDGTKVALWIHALTGPTPCASEVSCHGRETMWSDGELTHLWHTGYHSTEGDSARQTDELLHAYADDLARHGLRIADDCQRTWFFVHDVDLHYGGLVKARREFFEAEGLTPDTHYLASTGIQGDGAEAKSLVQLDAYAVRGLQPGQVTYLKALTHLNPTYEYGVTFERGTRIAYADRTHHLISGTASIDHKGQVVHVGDVVKQTQRMWENVEALLHEGGASMADVAHMLVYLRDPADYAVMQALFEERYPDVPRVFLVAPVCRPTWLIEMECMAIAPDGDATYPKF